MTTDLPGLIPASLTFAFRRAASRPYTITVTLAELDLEDFQAFNGSDIVAGNGNKVLQAWPIAKGGDTPSNAADLQTWATQAATDWYLWRLSKTSQTFAGFVPWEPDGLADRIVWTMDPSQTRVVPWTFDDLSWDQRSERLVVDLSLTGTQTGWALPDADVVRVDADSTGYTIQGIAGGYDGARRVLWNVGNNAFSIAHNSGSAAETHYKVLCDGSADLSIAANGRVVLEYLAADASDDGRWRAVRSVASTSGTITVQEQDGSPSYTGITTVQADQAAGFVVTNPSSPVALISQTAASTSTVGYVSVVDQTFESGSGSKTFHGTTQQVPIKADTDGIAVYFEMTNSAGGDSDKVQIANITDSVSQDADGTGAFPQMYLRQDWTWKAGDQNDTTAAAVFGTMALEGLQNGLAFGTRWYGSGIENGVYGDIMPFAIYDSVGLTYSVGQTGTLGDGSAVVGGIVTSIGGGSFVGDGDTLSTGLTFPLMGLQVLDDDASHTLKLTTAPLTTNATLEFELTGPSAILNISSSGAAIAGTNTGDVTLAGSFDYLTIADQIITLGAIDLSTDVTGALPLTGLATQSNQTILANVSGGVAVPSAVSLSSVLDIASSTRGTILYRGASGWAALATGTSGYYLQTAGAGADPSWADVTTAVASASTTVAGKVELATTAEVATGTDTARAVTPQGVGYHQGVAKSWVQFAGTGTVTIQDSYNVASITDAGTGNYTVNIDTDHANDDYCAVATAGVSGNRVYTDLATKSSFAVGTYKIITSDAAGTLIDADVVCGVTFGDW